MLGVEFPFIPETGDVPLVVDMSSNIFSRKFDITKVGTSCFSFILYCYFLFLSFQ